MMKTKKYLKLLTMALMLVLVIALVPQISSEAASTKKKALKAYKLYMENGRSENGRTLTKFGTALITKDNVPELICDDGVWTYIYTYKKGTLYRMFRGESYNVYKYYKKKNMINQFYGHRGYYTTYYMKYSDGEFEKKLKKEEWASGTISYSKVVNYNSKKIKKAVFSKQLKKYVGSAKASNFKMYDNTEQQRKKRLK